MLTELPDDILRLVSFWLNGFDNCCLWMASDLKLRHKLTDKIITEFYIRYKTAARYLWPGNFLKKLKQLSRLSFVVEDRVYHLPIENVELFPIETLKHLKLDFSPYYLILQKPNNLADQTSSNKEYIDLNELYCNLESFEFEERNRSSDGHLNIDFLCYLPKKLKTLTMPEKYLMLDPKDPQSDMNMHIALLPRTLTSLTLIVAGEDKPYLDFSKLPPNLASLTTNAFIQEQSFPLIPKSLTLLNLSSTEYDIQKLSPFLPTGLRSLSIWLNPNSVLDDSLSHLEHLEYLKTMCAAQDTRFISKYPPNLKMCHAFFESEQELKIVPFLGNLTELSLHTENGLNYEILGMLPQTLTYLSLYATELSQPVAFFGLLPKKLRSLESFLPVLENTSLLPDSLTELLLMPQVPCEIIHDRLPSKLKKLTLTELHLSESLLKTLPESLELLELTSELVIVDDEIISALPRGLKYLILDTQLDITNTSTCQYPPNIETLSLRGNDEINDDVIAHLPRSLTDLALPNNSRLTDNSISFLPRKLLSLSLPQCDQITYKCCKNLPQYLFSLTLPFENWPVESFIDLPPYLHIGPELT